MFHLHSAPVSDSEPRQTELKQHNRPRPSQLNSTANPHNLQIGIPFPSQHRPPTPKVPARVSDRPSLRLDWHLETQTGAARLAAARRKHDLDLVSSGPEEGREVVPLVCCGFDIAVDELTDGDAKADGKEWSGGRGAGGAEGW
ncbi:hypothetical protein V502_05600 [Pseudogymnoascus sp. VKM F-4520 (FW-2644)]|nr:hypothetical protein V502_05600 [Pseudogymnoascus sp. VKM F-4520 (FW-2644)]